MLSYLQTDFNCKQLKISVRVKSIFIPRRKCFLFPRWMHTTYYFLTSKVHDIYLQLYRTVSMHFWAKTKNKEKKKVLHTKIQGAFSDFKDFTMRRANYVKKTKNTQISTFHKWRKQKRKTLHLNVKKKKTTVTKTSRKLIGIHYWHVFLIQSTITRR